MTTLFPTLRRHVVVACCWLGVHSLLAIPGAPRVHAASSPNLVAHWNLDEGAGSVVEDATGAFPGQLSGPGATFVMEGVAGGALRLVAGLNGYVSFGNVLPLTGTPYTLSLWFKVAQGYSAPDSVLIGKHVQGTPNGCAIYLNSSVGTVAAFGGREPVMGANPIANDGRWHHVVMSAHATGELWLYFDGQPQAHRASIGLPIPSNAVLLLGGSDPGGPISSFTGFLDDVQVYLSALSPAEIQTLFANPGLSLPPAEPVVILPPGGTLPGSTNVTMLSNVTGAEIRYTLDGSEPTTTSTLYAGSFKLTLTELTVVRARAFLNGFPVSEIREVRYQPQPQLRFSPDSTRFTNVLTVALFTPIADTAIRFSTDGTEPTADSALYSAPLTLTSTTSLRARVFLGRFPVSEIFQATYSRAVVFDGDGISAAWRQLYFGPNYATDPRAATAADPDLDGATNLQEYVAGTHPLDPTSALRIDLRIAPSVAFPSVPGQKFRIHRRLVAERPESTVIAEVTATTNPTVVPDLTAPAGTAASFYVVERLP